MEKLDHGIYINTSSGEYKKLYENIYDNFSYKVFCDLKHKYNPREGHGGDQIP
jgi:hypothetical protein